MFLVLANFNLFEFASAILQKGLFSFLSNAIRVKTQFKENFKAPKTKKEATKGNTNDVTHEMYRTMFGHDVIHVRPCRGTAKSVSPHFFFSLVIIKFL